MTLSASNFCFSELLDGLLEHIFGYLSLNDVSNCARVCKNWNRFLSDENNEIWRYNCLRKLSEKVKGDQMKCQLMLINSFFQALKSDLLLSVPTYKSKLRAFFHAWNPLDSSRHIYIKPNAFTLHRNPVAQSTDGARAKIGFENGRHVWEIMWEGPLGTVAIVGISSKDAILQCHGYAPLLGKLLQTVLNHANENCSRKSI